MKSETIDLLATALASAQGEVKNAKINRQNPHFKNRYADLASVRDAVTPALAKHGLMVTQTMQMRDGLFLLETTLAHKSGQWISSEYPLPINVNPQILGSALTYARRYSLSSIVGIAADDDDDAESARKDNGSAVNETRITDEQFQHLVDLAESVSADRDKFAKYLKVETLADLPASRFKEATAALEAKRVRQ